MNQYIVTLTENGEEAIVGRYPTLQEAKQHLRSVRYWPEYRRCFETLDISEDGMTGEGCDETGYFTYNIKKYDRP